MKYRFEYNGNPSFVTLHVTNQVCKEGFVHHVFQDNISRDTKDLFALLETVPGVTELTLNKFSIRAQRGAAFSRDEVLEDLLFTYRGWCRMNGYDGEWTQLPTLRTDIKMTKCPDCMDAERREMEACMRDFDTLEF